MIFALVSFETGIYSAFIVAASSNSSEQCLVQQKFFTSI